MTPPQNIALEIESYPTNAPVYVIEATSRAFTEQGPRTEMNLASDYGFFTDPQAAQTFAHDLNAEVRRAHMDYLEREEARGRDRHEAIALANARNVVIVAAGLEPITVPVPLPRPAGDLEDFAVQEELTTYAAIELSPHQALDGNDVV
jgi:hypothetical protein